MPRRALRIKNEDGFTVREFFRGGAKLGGFLGRKGDGEPGWKTTWHDWEKRMLMIRGHDLGDSRLELQKCG